MNLRSIFWCLVMTLMPLIVLGQITKPASTAEIVRITGKVISEEERALLGGSNIIVKDYLLSRRSVGVSSDEQGNFNLFVQMDLPFVIQVSQLGFETKEITIEEDFNYLIIKLKKRVVELKEVVVRSEKIKQEILKSDISIEQLSIKQIQYGPSFDFYDAIANLKDVEVATQSMQFQSVNARGFNSTGNTRFVQMVDGMDNQAPGFGFPIGNFAGLSELDVEGVDLLPGPSSARYGPNAFNGILFMRSKDPFLYQGPSAYLKLAANRFPEGSSGNSFFDFGGDPVYDLGVRYAKAFNGKIAFKVNFSLISAEDWMADNLDNIGEGERFEHHPDIPGYDGVNVYGDEVKANLPLGPLGTNVTVSRTGYAEQNLFDYKFTNIKTNAAVHYKITQNITAVVQGNYGTGNTFYTGDNRIFLGDFQLFQGKAEISSPNFMVRGYTTQQRSGKSFDSRFLALHLMRVAKSDEQWFRDYRLAYNGRLISYGVQGGNHIAARKVADSELSLLEQNFARFEPGTTRFDSLRNIIINTVGFENGAVFEDNSQLYHLEGRYDFSHLISFVGLEAGGNYRLYDPESNGNLYPDTIGNDITMFEYGGFIEATKTVYNNRLKLTSSLRVDKNENFDFRYTPRFSAVYTLNLVHNFRTSVQTGFRNPTLREQFIFQDLGNARAVGGLAEIIEFLDLAGNAYFVQSVDGFNEAVKDLINPEPQSEQIPYQQDQAELQSMDILSEGLLGQNDLRPILPEQVSTFELGYRSLLSDKKLVIDATYYYNSYQNFIGVIRVVKPKTSPATDPFLAARQINNSTESDVFFITSNARETVVSQGFSFSVDFTSTGGFLLGVNGAWANLTSDPQDPIVPGFNTPGFKTNYTLGHNNMAKNLGFKFTLRIRRAFQWESNFGDGEVDNYINLDAQLNLRLPKIHSMIKAGLSNLGNDYYVTTFGGPGIGAIPYIQITYDPVFY
ncbi:MAG: TonB-dependent receptor plug domain-containing protein [Bacteroidetes bacterium]|nr:TonB-dependent receptor plug domain-containing protein [Bacteroidota bacterium]